MVVALGALWVTSFVLYICLMLIKKCGHILLIISKQGIAEVDLFGNQIILNIVRNKFRKKCHQMVKKKFVLESF